MDEDYTSRMEEAGLRDVKRKLETLLVPKAEHGRFDETMGDLHYLGSAKPADPSHSTL